MSSAATTLSIASILAESARRYPDRVALLLTEREITYATLWDQARRYAAVLRDRGIEPGDRIGLLIPNVPDFPRAYYAVQAIGGVAVPVHALLTAEEIAYILSDSGAKMLVCAGSLLGEGGKGAELAGIPLLSVFASEDTGVAPMEKLAAEVVPVASYVDRRPDDDAVIFYTSGTTGKPKGALLSQLNMVMNAQLVATDVLKISADDIVLGCLPLFHAFGQTVTMNAGFRAAATIVMMPRFDGAAALDLLVQHHVTILQGVPTMYLGLLEAARADERRPQLQLAVSGGASLPVAVLKRFKEVFGADIAEGYGLSETSPVATFNQEVFGRKPGSIGHPIWGVEVEIANAELEDRIELLPTGEIGEIVIRGHNVMKGYWNRPEATKAAIVDEWFRSGDLAVKDEEGFISIVDRKKDMVLRGGFNVYPREVEEVLAHHPRVHQVSVIGIPDPQYGEEICAVVVKDPSAAGVPDAELRAEITGYAKEHLAKYKYPRRIEFVDSFPLGPSGKVLKRELVEQFRDQ
ncbi:MAG TPA: long-chain fatty acid--CoA ligase [Mycobacteriales bacterium]|nr:long-chain fatty acid--CoA ligase [Mycobacteriales bacterium]